MKYVIATFFLYIVLLSPLFAKDFGLVLDTTPGYESFEGFDNPGKEKFVFGGALRPWFSSSLRSDMDIYLSAGVQVKYEREEFTLAPELYRTEFTWRPVETQSLSAGRIYYSDPLGFIAEGLFDGLAWTKFAEIGTFSAGAYYTGFLYKKTAYITVSHEELYSYNGTLDYADFVETYFAPSRALVSVDYANVFADELRLNLSLLGQFDLNGEDTYYHSEYLAAKAVFPWKNVFVFEAGAAAEFIETSGESFLFGLAGEMKFSWMPPGVLQDRLQAGARYASGRWGESSFAEFRPLTTETQGHVLRAKLSGLSVIETEYTVRLHRVFAADISASYFIRNDLSTYIGLFANNKEYFMGAEVYAELIWSPFSDIRFSLGGGAFLPQLGNTSPDSKPSWLVSLNITLAIL
jgi:hypothetical protein